jgi:hypothetical protein
VTLPFDHLREGGPGCPSSLVLDRLLAGELPPGEAAEVTAHAAACDVCARRVTTRRAGFAAFPGVDAGALQARIAARARPPAPALVGLRRAAIGLVRRGPRSVAAASVAAAAVAVAVLATVVAPRPPGEPSEETVAVKGGPALHVYRLRDERAEEVPSGTRVAPGDRLRFVVDLPAAGTVAIVGVERSGRLYTAWPPPGTDVGEARREGGVRQELAGAVAVDDAPGPETLYLVHCPGETAGPPVCTSRGAQVPPLCPAGCALTPFVLAKNR